MKTINAGKYNHKINIYEMVSGKDSAGFPVDTERLVLSPYASVKTTRGFTLIANDSDFEKAYTNFTIRYSKKVVEAYFNSAESNRKLEVAFKNKRYTVEYLNNIDEKDVDLELQCKVVLK